MYKKAAQAEACATGKATQYPLIVLSEKEQTLGQAQYLQMDCENPQIS